jgi:hypothetical protein
MSNYSGDGGYSGQGQDEQDRLKREMDEEYRKQREIRQRLEEERERARERRSGRRARDESSKEESEEEGWSWSGWFWNILSGKKQRSDEAAALANDVSQWLNDPERRQ